MRFEVGKKYRYVGGNHFFVPDMYYLKIGEHTVTNVTLPAGHSARTTSFVEFDNDGFKWAVYNDDFEEVGSSYTGVLANLFIGEIQYFRNDIFATLGPSTHPIVYKWRIITEPLHREIHNKYFNSKEEAITYLRETYEGWSKVVEFDTRQALDEWKEENKIETEGQISEDVFHGGGIVRDSRGVTGFTAGAVNLSTACVGASESLGIFRSNF